MVMGEMELTCEVLVIGSGRPATPPPFGPPTWASM